MNSHMRIVALTGSLLIAVSGSVYAQAVADSDSNLRAELTVLKARLAELEAKQDDTWLDQRRTEQVKALIHDVLSDADTRASLLADGVTAGHDGKDSF